MNKKKVTLVYAYLVLFAFTLGFAFASRVNAEQGTELCCVVEWCTIDPPQPLKQGHWVFGSAGYWVCVSTDHPCDIWTTCAEYPE